MKEETSEFFNKHSKHYLEMALKHDDREIPHNPDGYGKRTGDCGDTVEIFLTIQNKRIQQITFQVDGCMNTNACCNTLVHLVEGRSIDDAWQASPEEIAGFLESLPVDHFHCAELTVGALYLALTNCRELQKAPWKKNYQVRG
jgi:nitrogen fixation protein NifU and related proteins